jgi:cytochrome c-type biogenesis protein CcsB
LGIYAAPLIALIMIAVSQVPNTPSQEQSIFKNFWLISHVVTVFIGNAAFALACGIGILYLLQERAIKTKNPGFFFRRLPSLDMLDGTGYTCIIIGFTLLTFGLISGFIYAKTIWGRFWGWDPKEVWSGITWLFYAALLHGRLNVGWRGRRAAIMAIIGFAILLFTFLGVNFLLTGHHKPFTTF